MKVIVLGLLALVLSSCLSTGGDDTEADTSLSSSSVVTGTFYTIAYNIPTDSISLFVDSVNCVITNNLTVTPVAIKSPDYRSASIPVTATAALGDTLVIYVTAWIGGALISDSKDTVVVALANGILSTDTLTFTGALVNYLPVINAGEDISIYTYEEYTFNTATAYDHDDPALYLWWKSVSDADYTENSLKRFYKTATIDTIILKGIDTYGHEVLDTVVVTVTDYTVGDPSSATMISSSYHVMTSSEIVMANSSAVVSSAGVVSSVTMVSSAAISSETVSSSGMVSSSSSVPAPTVYELAVVDGNGAGSFAAGTEVTVWANPNDSGICFDQWVGDNISNTASDTTTFIMTAAAKTITASYAQCWNVFVVHEFLDNENFTMDWDERRLLQWVVPEGFGKHLSLSHWSHTNANVWGSLTISDTTTFEIKVVAPPKSSPMNHGIDTIYTKVYEAMF